MKFYRRLVWLVLALALAAPFFIKGPNGDTLWSVDALKSKWQGIARTVSHKSKKLVARDKEKHLKPITVYKYQDENGNWHYADEPSGHPNEQSELIDPNSSVIPAYSPITPSNDEPKEKQSSSSKLNNDSAAVGDIELPMILQPEKIDQLVDDTRSVREQIEKRPQNIDR